MFNLLLIKKYCIWIIYSLIVGNSALFVYSDAGMPAAHGTMSLANRHANIEINKIFKNNILLTLAYMSGRVSEKSQVDWSEIEKPFNFQIKLEPNDVFAFHDTVLKEYQNKNIISSNAHFSGDEGFLSSGYLYGDGVCHLASFIYRTAIQAGLNPESPVNHDFATIPDIPREYGVSIYTTPANAQNSSAQNLYIENNTGGQLILSFNYKGDKLDLGIIK